MKTHFFLDGKLHKKIKIVKSEDLIVAWDYEEEQRKWYSYSQVRKQHENAYEIYEVAQLINKRQNIITDLIYRRLLDKPSGSAYKIESRRPWKLFWSEQDVLNMRDRLFDLALKNKYGEPRADFKLISKAELLAAMRKDNSYYVKDEDGRFVKVWKNL